MDDLTFGAVKVLMVNIASFITAGGIIGAFALKVGKKVLDKSLQPFNEKINEMEKARVEQHSETLCKINEVQLYTDKNFLVRFLADVEQGNKVDDVEIERFYEVYKDYKDLGGNSYIQHKVEKLQKDGKL